MNRQEMFNTVYKHLMNQKERCIGSTGVCKYRFEGMKCAIGALIPDDKYDPKMDDGAWGGIGMIIKKFPVFKEIFGDYSQDDINFLIGLQDIHDGSHPESWKETLNSFADRNNLEIPLDSFL